MLTEQSEIITTFSEMAPRYESLMNSELNKFWGINYEDFVSRLLDEVHTNKDEIILDIATGTSFIPSYLIKKNKKFAHIIGLDLTFGMLINGKKKLVATSSENQVLLVCASAHHMPFQPTSFDHAICCLATHHMDAEALLTNINKSLIAGGKLHMADAGGSSNWKNKFIQLVIKITAFLYFLVSENFSRALAESAAIGNIHTSQEWEELLKNHGFVEINIDKLKSKKFWAPDPIFIKAIKKPKEKNDINCRSH